MVTFTDLWGSRERDNTVDVSEKRKQLEIDDREAWRQHQEQQRKQRNVSPSTTPNVDFTIKPR